MTELPPGRQALVDEIRTVQFRTVHFRTGYDMGVVDDLLDRAEQAAVAGDSLTEVLQATIPTVSSRTSYDVGEVDAFLARLRGQG